MFRRTECMLSRFTVVVCASIAVVEDEKRFLSGRPPDLCHSILRHSCFLSNGQNRVHTDARWPKPGTPFHASPRAPSYWPTPAQTRLWANLKRVHPILDIHPPISYPISITPTRCSTVRDTSVCFTRCPCTRCQPAQ